MALNCYKRYNLAILNNKILSKTISRSYNMNIDKEFRLLSSFNQNAKENMAIDKALATTYKTGDKPILRLYTWKKSFTVGVGQKVDDYIDVYKEYGNNTAKRITGGGVLFHGHDLSYSVIFPKNFALNLSVKQTYEKICSFLLEFYKSLGLKASFAKDIESIELSKSNFCQVGFEAYDIIVNGIKIGGNAQKWSKHMIFQHGSIPLKSVENRVELGNTLESFNINLEFEEAAQMLAKSFGKVFDVELVPSRLNEKENKKLEQLLEGSNDS